MRPPVPFEYRSEPHRRKHGPRGYETYESYKPWLRDEFTFRCVYCLERESWYPNRQAAFSVDHIVPRSEDATRVCDYENLVYACLRCNSAKREILLPNPTATAMGGHLRVKPDGGLDALTPSGQRLIEYLHLNDDPALATRRAMLEILDLKARYPNDPRVHEMFIRTFGFPANLPDLIRQRPPGGNSRPAGAPDCWYARRLNGHLPETY